MRTFLSENCSRVCPNALERGSCEGLCMPSSSKCLTDDHIYQHDGPQVKKMKLESQRKAISPLKFPGQLAPTSTKCRSTERLVSNGKEAANRTEKRHRRKMEMRPPKAIRDAVFIRTEPDGVSREMQLNCQKRQISSFAPCKDAQPLQIQKEMLYSKLTPGRQDPVSSSQYEVLSRGKHEVDRRPLVEMRRTDYEGMNSGFKVDKGALEVSENDSRKKVGSGVDESRNLKVTRFDKFKPIKPASEIGMEDREETGTICTFQSKTKRPKFRCQPAAGSSYGSKCDVGRTSYGCSRPKSSTPSSSSSSMIHHPELECFDMTPSLGVRVAVKHMAIPAPSVTACDSEGRKNESSSADKLDHLGSEVDRLKASEQNFAGRKSSTCSGIVGNVGLSDKSGKLNSSNAFRDENKVCLYRDEVRKVLDLYKDTLERLQQEKKLKLGGEGKKGMQIYVDAAMQLKEQHKWLNVQKCVGAVPGVEVGDKFHRRAELVIIGLHSKFVAGIDFKKIDGTLFATSIVSSGRYGDKNDSSDVLIYVGEGGNSNCSSEKLEDQKLVRGNLALKNSIDKFPVRVIRSIQNVTAAKSMHANTMDKSKYFYDGLYLVRQCWPEREPCGNLVFKFRLERIQGQQVTRWNTQNTRKSNKASHDPVVVHDISKGKENMPIRAVNAIDCEKPPPLVYTTKVMYHPQQCAISKPSVCDCLNGCTEEIPCSCIVKNNCEASVNSSITIAGNNPIVYECGPDCKCPPACKNRMTQHGIKLQLEIFKTLPKGWGVRCRNFISKGRFICEYVGELLQYRQEEGKIAFDKLAFDAGNSYGPEDSQGYPPNLQKVDDAKNVKFGNVGSFIRHSCSSNLYAKCVLFDHEDKGRPHVMLFAAKNIPPRKELTFDYNSW